MLILSQAHRLGTSGRPEEVHVWLKGGRRLNVLPEIDVADFATQWRKWWTRLQPVVRIPSTAAGWPLLRPASADIDWSRTRRGGRNGLLVVVITLMWW
ncbi:hypothetical protein BD410DRAFT_703192, partial [Rickenella mellea]